MNAASIRRKCLTVAAVILWVTALIKLLSVFNTAGVITLRDPVIEFLKVKQLLVITACYELLCSWCLMSSKLERYHPLILISVASTFVLYHIGLVVIGYHGVCPCLGTITDWIPISQGWINPILITIIIFLFLLGCDLQMQQAKAAKI